MFTVHYWKQAAERAVKTAAQTVIAGLALSNAGPVDAFQFDYKLALGFACGGAFLSVLTSVASSGFGDDDSPSLVK